MGEPCRPVGALFREAAGRFASKPAVIFLGERYRYAQLDAWSDALAGALARRQVLAGDKVLLYAPHCPQWIVAWLALQKIGAVAVPVTHFYGPDDLRYIANDCGAETAICMDTNFGHLDKVLRETRLRQVIVTGMVDLLPTWKRAVAHLLDRIPTGKVRAGPDVLSFRALLAEGAPPRPCDVGADALCEMLYTGGTTGFPKGVPISHAALVESSRAVRQGSLAAIPEGENVTLQGAPLYHILGQVVGLGALLRGETVILLPKIALDAVFDHVERHGARTILGTPTLYRMMLEHDRVDQYDLSGLRYCFCAGDALPPETDHRWRALTGQRLYQGYGATETCGGVTQCPAGV
ncbi:MAG TPA: long-chain fatty acid--CoA ligase, partial [Gemmatimonadales bacterium]